MAPAGATMRFASVFLLATFALVALAGCVTVDESIKIDCDGAGGAADSANSMPTILAPAVQPAVDDEPLVLGTLLPLTGDLEAFGQSMEKAAMLAIEQINDAGGVNGHDVMLKKGDSKTSATEAPNAFSSLVNEGVMGIAGAASSGVTGSILDLAMDNDVFVFSPASTSPALTVRDNDGWFARVPPSDALQGQVLASLVYDSGCRDVNILAVNNDYGVGLGEVFEDSFEAKGGSVGGFVKFDPAGTSFASQVEQAGKGKPDAIVFIGYPQTGVQIMKEAFQKGIMTDSVFFFSEGVKDEDNFVKAVGETSKGAYILAGLRGTTPEFGTPDAFKAAFEARWGEEPTLFAAETYDAIVGMALAAAYAGDNSADAVKANLRAVWNAPGAKMDSSDMSGLLTAASLKQDIDYVGVANDFDLDDVGDPTSGVYSVWRVEVDGSIATIESDITA